MAQRSADWRTAIVSAYHDGKSVGEIGRTIGPSRSTVSRELTALGLTLRPRGAYHLPQTIVIPKDVAVLAYIAGMFDGEGNLYWRRREQRTNGARFTIYSTTAEVLDWIAGKLGVPRIRWDHKRVERAGWKPIGRIEISRSSDVVAILRALLPYLIIKRDLAVTVIADLTKPRT